MADLRDFQALILAGGRGTRLRPYTDNTPKPLLRVMGKPLLSYIIDEVRQSGIEDICVVVDYKKEDIQSQFPNLAHIYNPYGTMIDGVFLNLGSTSKNFVFGLSGDTLLTRDSIKYSIENYNPSEHDALLTLSRLPEQGMKKWSYAIDKNTSLLEDISLDDNFTYSERSGLILKTSSVRRLMPADLPFKIDERYSGYSSGWNLLLKLMVDADMKIKALYTEFPIFNVNTIDSYQKSEEFVKQHLLK